MGSIGMSEPLTPFGHALAGALGGVFSNAVVYPLDTVKTRIQASSTEKGKGKQLSVISLLLRILREEGISGYYNGFGASMLNTFSMQYAYFFFYSFVRNSYIKRISRSLSPGSKAPPISTAMELALGAVAGALAQIFTIPVSVIATRQQIGRPAASTNVARAPTSPSDVSDVKPSYATVADPSTSLAATPLTKNVEEQYDNSFLGVAQEIVRQDGVTGLWRGLKPGLVLTVNPAITYGTFERVKGMLLLAKEKSGGSLKLNPWQAFFVGALSKTLATVVTYPYIMAKVRIQAGSPDQEEELPQSTSGKSTKTKPRGSLTLLAKVWKDQGFVGWYQGMGAQITKAVLSQALLFMSKDQFEQYALVIMLFYRRLIQF